MSADCCVHVYTSVAALSNAGVSLLCHGRIDWAIDTYRDALQLVVARAEDPGMSRYMTVNEFVAKAAHRLASCAVQAITVTPPSQGIEIVTDETCFQFACRFLDPAYQNGNLCLFRVESSDIWNNTAPHHRNSNNTGIDSTILLSAIILHNYSCAYRYKQIIATTSTRRLYSDSDLDHAIHQSRSLSGLACRMVTEQTHLSLEVSKIAFGAEFDGPPDELLMCFAILAFDNHVSARNGIGSTMLSLFSLLKQAFLEVNSHFMRAARSQTVALAG